MTDRSEEWLKRNPNLPLAPETVQWLKDHPDDDEPEPDGITTRPLPPGELALVEGIAGLFPDPEQLVVVRRDDLDRLVRIARAVDPDRPLGIAFMGFDWLGAQP